MGESKYILLEDLLAKIVPVSTLQTVRQTLSSITSRKTFRGDLFKDMKKVQQPIEPGKMIVVSLEDYSTAIEVDAMSLAKLTEDEADLLLPVATAKERYDLFNTRTKLEEAINSSINDKVRFIDGNKRCKGIIKHKGKLEGKKGIYFGIRLESPLGEGDGLWKGTRHFYSRMNHATFVSLEKVEFSAADGKNGSMIENKRDNVSATSIETNSSFDTLDSFKGLKLGMRVVAFGQEKEDKEKILRGAIRFIGKLRSNEEVIIGIELDTPDGSGNGIFKTQRVFECKRNHALFTGVNTIINEEDYVKDSFEHLYANEEMAKDRKRDLQDKKDQVTKNKLKYKDDSASDSSPKRNEQKYEITIKRTRNSEPSKAVPVSNDQHPLSNDELFESKDKRAGVDKNNKNQKINSGVSSSDSHESKDELGAKSLLREIGTKITNDPPSYENAVREDRTAKMEYQTSGTEKFFTQKMYDRSLQVDSVVEVSLNGVPHYGVIRWIGVPHNLKSEELIAGLELEEPYEFGTDGIFKGTQYFSCLPGRGFFVKLSNCKKDARFTYASHIQQSTPPKHQKVDEIEGCYLPPERIEDAFIGPMLGIQGHHNSCYMDSTLFAMFAFSFVFDAVLYRERRSEDIVEYDDVRRVLRNSIVNPLRSKGFVNAGSVLQLRRWLDKLGSVQGFMNEEKDPEEFLMLLFRDVLKVDPFITLRTDAGRTEKAFFYQIWVDKDANNPLPSLQYLIEQSFLTGNLKLEEVPSVFIVQLPRFGMQKIYKRIRLNAELDISKVMSTAVFSCLICGNDAIVSCRDCCQSFGWESPFVYLCGACSNLAHRHPGRFNHQPKHLTIARPKYQKDDSITVLDLFAVVCIKTSHYVTFAKCGEEPNDKWVFFDSMADRVGGEFGHNVPEVVQCPEVKKWFDEKPLNFTESDTKNTPEKILRLFEDASLCLYKSRELSIYK